MSFDFYKFALDLIGFHKISNDSMHFVAFHLIL